MFAVIYTLEAIIKVVSLGKTYFEDGWNNFDFVIVVVAWIGFFLEKVFQIKVGEATTIIRSFRIARVFKMVKRFKKLRQIFNTFLKSLP